MCRLSRGFGVGIGVFALIFACGKPPAETASTPPVRRYVHPELPLAVALPAALTKVKARTTAMEYTGWDYGVEGKYLGTTAMLPIDTSLSTVTAATYDQLDVELLHDLQQLQSNYEKLFPLANLNDPNRPDLRVSVSHLSNRRIIGRFDEPILSVHLQIDLPDLLTMDIETFLAIFVASVVPGTKLPVIGKENTFTHFQIHYQIASFLDAKGKWPQSTGGRTAVKSILAAVTTKLRPTDPFFEEFRRHWLSPFVASSSAVLGEEKVVWTVPVEQPTFGIAWIPDLAPTLTEAEWNEFKQWIIRTHAELFEAGFDLNVGMVRQCSGDYFRPQVSASDILEGRASVEADIGGRLDKLFEARGDCISHAPLYAAHQVASQPAPVMQQAQRRLAIILTDADDQSPPPDNPSSIQLGNIDELVAPLKDGGWDMLIVRPITACFNAPFRADRSGSRLTSAALRLGQTAINLCSSLWTQEMTKRLVDIRAQVSVFRIPHPPLYQSLRIVRRAAADVEEGIIDDDPVAGYTYNFLNKAFTFGTSTSFVGGQRVDFSAISFREPE